MLWEKLFVNDEKLSFSINFEFVNKQKEKAWGFCLLLIIITNDMISVIAISEDQTTYNGIINSHKLVLNA